MPYSLWKDTTGKNIEEILTNSLEYEEWHETSVDPYDQSELKFSINKCFDDSATLNFGENNITYNVIEYEIENIRTREANNEIRATRIKSLNGFVIVFTDGNVTKFITNKGYNPNTLSILRKLNNYKSQKEIIEEKFSIDSDVFFWLVSKVIDSPGVLLGETQDVKIELVTGFKGKTDDKLAEITGVGDRILNLISTLTFLFETENLSLIEISLNHKDSTYGLKLGTNSYIDIEPEKYMGDLMFLPDEEMLPKVLLTVFLLVVPDLLNIYDQEIEEDCWNNEVKTSFLKSIGENIHQRILGKLGLE